MARAEVRHEQLVRLHLSIVGADREVGIAHVGHGGRVLVKSPEGERVSHYLEEGATRHLFGERDTTTSSTVHATRFTPFPDSLVIR